jgi:hypothetical protein
MWKLWSKLFESYNGLVKGRLGRVEEVLDEPVDLVGYVVSPGSLRRPVSAARL